MTERRVQNPFAEFTEEELTAAIRADPEGFTRTFFEESGLLDLLVDSQMRRWEEGQQALRAQLEAQREERFSGNRTR